MTNDDHACPVCGWTPDDSARYPEDRLIDHYDETHSDA